MILEIPPPSDGGHLVVIVGGGGGETDGRDSVTECYRAGKLDDGKIIVKRVGNVVWMVNELAKKNTLWQ